MSPLARAGGCRHYVRRLAHDSYEIGWFYEVKYGRILGHRRTHRETDAAGAMRFVKKHDVPAFRIDGQIEGLT